MYFKNFIRVLFSAAAKMRYFLSTQLKQKYLIREVLRLLIASILYFYVDIAMFEKWMRIFQLVERFI